MMDKDYTKAPALFKIAADQGLPQAQYFYAKTLKDGRGIPQDRVNAYVWYTIAADAGYAMAGADLNEIDSGGYLTMRPDLASEGEGPRYGTGGDSGGHCAWMFRVGRRV